MKTLCRASFLILAILSVTPIAHSNTGSFAIHEQDFETLFNYSSSQSVKNAAIPKDVPWIGSYWAYKRDGIAFRDIKGQYGTSPADRFDEFWGLGSATYDWEKKEHTCSHLKGDQKKSCEGWWGHCNAWAGAAVKEAEPRKSIEALSPVTKKKHTLSVADQKGLLTEAYMSVNSLFAGQTDKSTETSTSWIHDKDNKSSQNWIGYGLTTYDAFWDVTPRAFFHIFTNYIGLNRMGVVIDRFTGDQVWNQPVVAYRLLPLNEADIVEVQQDNKTLYQVHLRMKIYWAEDGVHEWEVSDDFSLERTHTSKLHHPEEKYGHHFTGRLIEFYLFFTQRPEIYDQGTRVVSKGRIVGDGLWYHQTEEGVDELKERFLSRYNISESHPEFDKHFSQAFNETHPDFIWLPTQLVASNGYGNPYVTEEKVRYMLGESKKPDQDAQTEVTELSFRISNFFDLYPRANDYQDKDKLEKYVKRKVKAPLGRAGIQNRIKAKDLTISGGVVEVTIHFPTSISRALVSKLLGEQGFDLTLY